MSPETSERITQTILKTVPRLHGNTTLSTDQQNNSTSLDVMAMEVLRRGNPGSAYYQLWVKEFDAADEDWRERLWDYAYSRGADEKALEPIVAWAERRLKNNSVENASDDADTRKAADYLRSLSSRFSRSRTSDSETAEQTELTARMFMALKSSPMLDNSWWLSQPLVYRRSNNGGRTYTDQNIWPSGIKSEITRVAIETLENDASTPMLVAQACMILANGANLDADARSQVLTAVNSRLTALCANPETLRARVSTDGGFGSFLAPNINAPFGPQKSIFQFNDSKTAYLALLYLDVMKSLDDRPSVSQGLSDVLSQVQPSRDLLTTAREKSKSDGGRNTGNSSFEPGSGLRLTWPDLTIVESGESFGFNARSVESIFVRTIWGIPDPTFTNWFDYCILQHPVMQDYLASIEKPADNAQPAEVEKPAPMSRTQKRPTSPATEPVFDGKNLTEWLHVIQTDRSPETLVVALKACSALTTPAASERITETLLKVLPTWPGTMELRPGQFVPSSTDRAAFALLAKTNPDRKYFEMLVSQYASLDAGWRTRLASQIDRGNTSDFSNVEPLLVWAENIVRKSDTATVERQDLEAAATMLVTYIEKYPENQAFVTSATSAIKACNSLASEWWLARPVGVEGFSIPNRPTQTVDTWPVTWRAEVIQRAISTLDNPKSSETAVAQAAMILAITSKLTPEQKAEILPSVIRRLIESAKSPELLLRMVDVASVFEQFTVPIDPKKGTFSPFTPGLWWRQTEGNSLAKACVACELLDLLQLLQTASTPNDSVDAVWKTLSDVVTTDFRTGAYIGSWPDLKIQIEQSSNGSPVKFSLKDLPPADILKIVLHEHPALKEHREKQAAANNPPEKKADQ